MKVEPPILGLIKLNTIHRESTGSDHSYIDQDVTSGASPTFNGENITGVSATDSNAIHGNVSGEIVAISNKLKLDNNDVLLTEDNGDSDNKKSISYKTIQTNLAKIDIPHFNSAFSKAFSETEDNYVVAIGDSSVVGTGASANELSYMGLLTTAIEKQLTGNEVQDNLFVKAAEAYSTSAFLFSGSWALSDDTYALPEGHNGVSITTQIPQTSTNGDYVSISTEGATEIEVIFVADSSSCDAVTVYHALTPYETIDLSTATDGYYVYKVENIDFNIMSFLLSPSSTQKPIKLLGVFYNDKGSNFKVVNVATPGTKASDWYQHIKFIEKLQPATTFIGLGGNDLAASVSATTYKAQIQDIIDVALVYGNVILISYHDWNTVVPEFLQAIIDYRQAQYELANENEGVEIVDMSKVMVSGAWANSEGLLSDTVHPNDSGYYYMYSYLRDAMNLGRTTSALPLYDNAWIRASESWTYASANTFTISGDYTDIYQKGDKVKYQQATLHYGTIIDVSYSSPNTTVTLAPNSDYSVEALSILNRYYSKSDNPQGFPQFFNYTPTGISASNVSISGRFNISGNRCFVDLIASFTGAITFTTMPSIPIASATTFNVSSGGYSVCGTGTYNDNGTNYFPNGVYPCVDSNSSIVYVRSGINGTAMSTTSPITWANGDELDIHFSYEI